MPCHAVKHLLLSLLLLGAISTSYLFGEGSVNFINYPGHRLFYNASVDQQLKVYASSGEFINVGASHVGIRGGFIQVYRPDGTLHSTFDGNNGLAIINNNIEELNGPTGGGSSQGAGYIPGVIAVQESETGIWSIKLDYPEHNFDNFQNILNNAAWTRESDQPLNRRVVLAWDITVTIGEAGNEEGSLQTGRVYSNEYISMINRNGTTTSPVFYVLSKDGYQYQLNFNQTDPFGFPLSANNKGVVNGDQQPTYQSARQSDLEVGQDFENWQSNQKYLYPPQSPDSRSFINHKLFFSPPDPDMPSSALVTDIFGQVTHATWLYSEPRPVEFAATGSATIIETALIDTTFQLSNKYVYFESSHEGMVQIKIDVDQDGNFQGEVDVYLSKFITSGKDSISWDGSNGLGIPLLINQDTSWEIAVTFQAGEIHIFNQDVENDLGGLSITRINGNNAPLTEFYYDHSPVGGTVSGNGTPLNAKPTRETFTYDNNFGNEILFDYWAFAILEEQLTEVSVSINQINQYTTDRDQDGILDNVDEDDDNDGITDVEELCFNQTDCIFLSYNPNGDEDGDGIENFQDTNDPAFQLICPESSSLDSCTFFPFWMNMDRDSFPNFLDDDSDNDGIFDGLEGSEDADLDSIPNFLDNDSDNDGILDGLEGSDDVDLDSIPNFLDDDSDNDGILDGLEGIGDIDQDSIPNFLDYDSDNDGILDGLEGIEDVDLDSIPNFLDDDSDNDGILDGLEGIEDVDLDSIPNYLDDDSDNDGILDGLEGIEDVDLDSIPNYLDDDSDNDGILDGLEGIEDVDLDSIPNYLDDDSDNDGILDGLEGIEDVDLDSIPNFLDDDSDNDGILDGLEGIEDVDLDSIPNFLDDDSDNDGILDGLEGIEDVDLDSIPNFLDNDSDNDGILDGLEGIEDVDLDSIPNYLDDDSDNDGILDGLEGIEDVDLDSIPNYLDDDSDNDGILDGLEGIEDVDLDSIPNYLDDDSDNDGILDGLEGIEDVDLDSIPNFLDDDSDNDGILDGLEGIEDVDLDSIPNYLDDDSDNDGILDGLEGIEDVDLDSIPNFLDEDSDNDGILDGLEGIDDVDLDSIPNFLDDDSDNDGILDGLEGIEDIDLDSIPNFLDNDSDNDGILDGLEGIEDVDLDSIPNYLDDDSDNDGILDGLEGIEDVDLDSIPNYLDDDSDNDGILDGLEGIEDVDLDSIPNYLDDDSDNDGILDGLEGIEDVDLDSIPNYLDDDSDNDGILDGLEGIEDVDLDSIPNFLDEDSDNDGILDGLEGIYDVDLDSIPNFLDDDSDNDGILDGLEGIEDIDLDSIPNFLDNDSDNDGILDGLEGIEDVDLDSIPNYLDDDSDNDGILDGLEGIEDVDLDSIPNYLDDDSDNDGILDGLEGIEDVDLDSIPNFLDEDSDNDGILDGLEGIEDVDLDSIPNYLDDDSDNDGILDGLEGIEDVDLDSIPNYLDDDSDNDGILDGLEGIEDVDLDSIPNYLDDDSDNDGILDGLEGIEDVDLDSIPNYLDDDSDNDGILDGLEGIEDVDLDSIPNYLDDDSDNDGILDGLEGIEDVDLDSIPNYLDDDSDNDGILDGLEGIEDVDLDSIPNYLDDDSDNDGILDGLEGIEDVDLDSIPNYLDDDSDNDGILDGLEGIEDVDLDSIPNYLDDDSDNDGILDCLEGIEDVDLDSIPNYLDDDSDNDGILDGLEGIEDVDLDSIPNYLDDDSDNDGILDGLEGIEDVDLDSIPNYLDDDSDNDGILDGLEGIEDVDLDSIPNYLDDDSDNDGILDGLEGIEDVDLDSIPNYLDDDSDNDGILDGLEGIEDVDLDSIPNFLDEDSDNDGILDDLEGIEDIDQDSIPNYLDDDSDNDGILDGLEGIEDVDLDSIPNYLDDDSDNDGILDGLEGSEDTDGDTIPDFLDRDSDNDGIPDAIEGDVDTDSDGIPNRLDLDSDNDGINDVKEIGGMDLNGDGQADGADENGDGLIDNPPSVKDSDQDSIPNHLDLDSDNDGVLDIVENGEAIADENNDGMADGLDEDGDGIPATVDDNEALFGEENDTPLQNTDDTDEPDYLDIDSDNDGITDLEENGNGLIDQDKDGRVDPLIEDADGDGIPSPIDQNPTVFGNFSDKDIDGDGIENKFDIDDDNDGIVDSLELCINLLNCPFANIDPAGDEDEDGILNIQDANDPNFRSICVDVAADGVCDYYPIEYDSDQDEVPNHLDLDSDNDGISDVTEAGFWALDKDGDGRVDGLPIDFGNNGLFNNLPSDSIADSDGDGVYNFIDIDGDNDGIFDIQEGQYALFDADNNGRFDNTSRTISVNSNGFKNAREGDILKVPLDSDNGEHFDIGSRAISVNNDGVGDVIEGGTFIVPSDSDKDLFYNAIDLDSDNDGIGDVIEGGSALYSSIGDILEGGNSDSDADGFIGTSPVVVNLAGQPQSDAANIFFLPYTQPLDSDSDGFYNFIDLDSDNDGIGDVIEGGTALRVATGGIGDVLEGGNLDRDKDGFLGTSPLTFNNLGQPIDDPTDLLFIVNAYPNDTDGDGISNLRDLDSDNDGIGDVIEGGTALRVATGGIGDVLEGGNLDRDKDGFLGTSPLTFNNLGQPIDDPTDLLFIVNAYPNDTDGDGISNLRDLDSDNDGIGDVIEGGTALRVATGGIGDVLEGGNLDRDKDGFLGTSPLTFNNLGQPIDDPTDLLFIVNAYPNDTDGDGISNLRDLDSDNDGIGDVIEGGTAMSLIGNTGGVGDVLEGGNMDLNADGFLGTTSLITNGLGQPIGDASDFTFNLNILPLDSDGDGVFNFIDSDSDNDGIGDVIEGGTANRVGGDGIGDVIEGGNNLSLDFNNNGFLGSSDVTTNEYGQPVQSMSIILPINTIPTDTDDDGIFDLSDLDADDDGINDVLEAGGIDQDGNGFQDGVILPSGSTGTFLEIKDLDLDSIPDFLDLDRDGDGIFDLVENLGQASDSDGNGKVDGVDTDADGIKDLEDGLPNEFGDAEESKLEDTDRDGIPNIVDVDTDNDGISDEEEIAFALNNGDTDEDSIPDYLDLDSDNDGINDVLENGIADANGDGQADGEDSNQDGIIDTLMGLIDSDNDGIPNQLDLDSDNDGIVDLLENGYGIFDRNGDGLVDSTDTDRDGIKDLVDGLLLVFGDESDKGLLFSDTDTIADYLDLDSDGDGIWDITENGWSEFDTDANGRLDFLEDIDNNGIVDTIPLPYVLLDVDQDDISNHIDADSDNDQFTDLVECPTPEDCPDFDQDGIPDYLDADCNQLSIPSIQLIASDTIVCAGSSLQLKAINTQPSPFAVSYEWAGTNKILISESNSQADTFELTLPNVDKSVEGYYRFSIQSQQGNCAASVDSVFIQVIEEQDLLPTLTIDQEIICAGTDIKLTATISNPNIIKNFNWYKVENNTRTLIENTSIPFLIINTIEAAGTITYEVEAVSINCGAQFSNEATIAILEENISISARSSNSLTEPICLGSSLQFTADFIDNATYQWITPKGDTIKQRVLNFSSLSKEDEGSYYAIATIGNCFSTTTPSLELSITSIETPVIEPIEPSCLGATVILQIQNPKSNTQYDWYQSATGYIKRTTEPTLILTNNLQASEAQSYYAIALADNCLSAPSQEVQVQVLEPAIENAIAGTDQTLCNQNSIQLNASIPTIGMGSWSTLNGNLIGTIPNPTVPLQLGSNSFVWTLQHPTCSATSSDTVIIENNAKPIISAFAGDDQILCLSSSSQLNAATLPATIQGNWQSLNATTIEQENAPIATVQNLQEGTNVFIWTLSTNECPAFSQDTVVIRRVMPPNEIAQAGTNQVICQENNFTLNASPPTQSIGQWTSLSGNQFLNSADPFSEVNNLQEGDNQLVWSLSTEVCKNFSADTIIIQKTIPPIEEAFAGMDKTICVEESIQLEATPPTLATGVWTTNQALSFENSANAQTSVSNFTDGKTLLIWSLSTENCLNYDRDTIEILKVAPPSEIAQAGSDQRMCNVESIQLSAQQSTTATGAWSSVGNVMLQDINNPSTLVTNLNSQEAYQFIWSLSTELCSNFSTDTLQVLIDRIPNVAATIKREEFESTPSPTQPEMDVVFCDPNSIMLEAILPDSMIGQWQTNSLVSLEQLPDGRALITDIQEDQLHLVWSLSQNSCDHFSSDTIDIEILRADGLEAKTDQIDLFFNEPLSEIDLITNDHIPENMEWTFEIIEEGEGGITNLGEGFIDYTPRTNFFGEDKFIYQLCHAECPELCDTTQIIFQVRGIDKDQSCFVPNIITPNGDGLNDLFTVPCLSEYPNNELSIFNRWGDEVFRATPYKNNWEGTHKFSPLPSGTYFYYISLTDDPQEKMSGYFTIVR